MIGSVVAANGQHRPVAFDHPAGSFEGVKLRAFNVHFDEGSLLSLKRIVEANAPDLFPDSSAYISTA